MNGLSKDAAGRVEIDESMAGQRLDNCLMRLLKGVPKSHVYRIVRSGEVRVNSKRARPDTRVVLGDQIRIPPIRTAEAAPKPGAPRSSAPLPVMYEDDVLIAIDKPAGLAVHGGSGVAYGVIEALRAERPDARFLELAHRLDRDTSGILFIAKTRSALLALHRGFREGGIDKRYLVLVRGKWRDAKRRVELPLTKYLTAHGERRVRVESDTGKLATTVFYRREVWPDAPEPVSLLEAELKTGRTHQIRVHLTHLGFPLAGDAKYGDFPWNRELARRGLKRMFLHAARVELPHPLEDRMLRLESPLPGELSSFLRGLAAVRA